MKAAMAVLATLLVGSLYQPGAVQAIGTAPSLGTADSFAVLGASEVTNTGPTIVNGNLGVSPGSAVTGFPPGIVVGGVIHAADAVALQAQSDTTIAYNNLAGQACDSDLTGQNLGGLTLTPGVYCFSSSAFLTGTLTLNGQGDPDAVFIFQIGSTLITAPGSQVVMINAGQPCNVFWQVGSSATLDTTTDFIGNILALASISMNTGATLRGRALARTGAVTMDSNVITRSVCSEPGAPDVELELTKTGSPDPVIAGQNLTYVLTVTNNGTSPAPDVSITDNLPLGTVFVSATPSAGGVCVLLPGNIVRCDWAGDTPPGGVRSVTIVVRVCPDQECGTIANTAVADSTVGDPDAVATITTVQARSDLVVDKTAPATVIAGNTLSYQIQVSNLGPSNSAGTVVVDTLPAGVTFVSATSANLGAGVCSEAGGVVTCDLGVLGAAAQCAVPPLPTSDTITITVRVCSDTLCGTILSNNAQATSTNCLPDPNPGNSADTTQTVVQTQSDLSIVKTQTSPPGNVVIAGQNVTYSIVVTNSGPSSSVDTIVTDNLSANLRFVSATSTLGTCSAVGQLVTCTLGTLGAAFQCAVPPAPTTATITLVARACPEVSCGTVISNTASVTGGDVECQSNLADPTPGNNTSAINTTVQTRADLSLTKTQTNPAGNVVVAGENVTYSIVVTNSGPSNSLGAVVTDILPANLQFVSVMTTSGSCSVVGQTVTCNLGAMGPVGIAQCTTGIPLPSTATITLVARACPEAECGGTISNTASVVGTPPVECEFNLADPTPTNNSATALATVQVRSDLSITKTGAPSPVTAGQNLTYQIVVTNSGPSNSQNTVMVDTLPVQTTFVSATPSQGTCSEAAGVVTCSLGTLGAVGGSQCAAGIPPPTQATITIVVQVRPDTPSSDPACGCDGAPLENVASVSNVIPGCESFLPDPTPANNTTTLLTIVRAGSDVELEEPVIDAPDCIASGDVLTVFQTFGNTGPCATTFQPDGPGNEFEVNLPPGVVGVPGSCSIDQDGGTCVVTSQQVAWNGPIAVGEVIMLQYRVRVRGGQTFGATFCLVGEVNYAECNVLSSGQRTAALCLAVDCPPTVNPNAQLGGQVHLPILNFQGQNDVCRTWIEVQNIGDEFSKAALVTWGEPGFCPPQCAGPLKVECSGLLKPGSTWNFLGAQVPSGSKSGILFSFTARQLSDIGVDLGFDDIVADVLCETLFFGVVGDCDDYRRFKKAYNEGLEFAGIPLDRAVGGYLAVEVLRHCPGDVTPGVEVSSKYGGIAGQHLGAYDPVFGGYAYYVPLVYAQANDFNSIIYIQNGGLECSSVEIWFKEQDDCLRARICEIFTLAPGETYQFDPNDCVGPAFQGSAWLRSSQPMGIAVDLIGKDVLMTYIGEPTELNYTFDPNQAFYTMGNQVAYGPLIYSEYQGWDSGIQVQNMSSVVAAKVKVYFLDRSGGIVTTLVDWICPRGSQTFFLPVIADLPGNWVGSVRVESQEWWSPGDPLVLPPNIVGVATLIKYTDAARSDTAEAIAYNLLPEHKAYDWQIGFGGGGLDSGIGLIAIPSLVKDLDGTGVTTELAITNLVPKPGFTDFAIYIYDQNGLLDFVCEKLNEKQVEYIDLETWGYLNPGFKGSAIISAVFWEHDVFDETGFFLRNLVGLAAVMVERTGTRLGEDVPGDEAAGTAGIPFRESAEDDNEFFFDFEGPVAPLCPGVGNRPAPGECADTSVNFDAGPGTGAPPPTLGGYDMTPFPPDPQPFFTFVPSVESPLGGDLGFNPPLEHRAVPGSWGTWSHGYTGDVYFTGGGAVATLILPTDTAAFYFYVEGNAFGSANFEAVHSDGTTSGVIPIVGASGATYFGFYTPCGTLDSITITNTDGAAIGFAVGEFGIASQPNN